MKDKKNSAKEKVHFSPAVEMERALAVNAFMLGKKDKEYTFNIEGKSKSVQHWENPSDFEFANQSYVEILALFMLDNVVFQYASEAGVRDEELTLRELMNTGVQTFDDACAIATEPGCVQLEFVQSKTDSGIQGSTFYYDWNSVGKSPEKVIEETLAAIYGLDRLGITLTQLMYTSYCPNIIDVLSDGALTELSIALTMCEYPITNLQNYFMIRDMTYLDESVFCKEGILVGVTSQSFVMQYVPSMIDAISLSTLKAQSAETDFRDLMIIKADSKKNMGYFTLAGMLNYLKSVPAGKRTLDPYSLANFGAISYSEQGES